MKKKRERRIAMLLAIMMLIMNLIVSPVWAAPGVAIDETNFPDNNFRDYVSKKLDKDHNGKLSDTEIAGVTAIDVSSNHIADLKGIEYFTALQKLYCSYNQLTSLDISKNPALKVLDCHDNKLTNLDVSKNPALEELNCSVNQLSTLDISKNTALISLICFSSQLTNLDVSKNTALQELECDGNQLTSLDVSKNTALQRLECWENQLTSLDVSKNTALQKLNCKDNQLTSLDVSKNTALIVLHCNSNQLTSLDVSKNTALEELWCDGNQLTNLDVSKNTALKNLRCSDNQLTSLDVSKNSELVYLDCMENQLTSLDLSHNAVSRLKCNAQKYDVEIRTTDMKIPYADFPGTFDIRRAGDIVGADSNFKVDITKKPSTVTYNYYTGSDSIFGSHLIMYNVTLNITYYVYIVTFNTNGGTEVSVQIIKKGDHVTIPTAPTKNGYTFDGWYKDAGLTTPFDFANETINADITLYAKWNENPPAPTSYTVTFNTNGGSAVNQQTITAGGLVTKPADPTKDSFTFDGWYKDAGLTKPFDFVNETINADTTLYAKWTQNAPTTYTVTFNANGHGTAPASITVNKGAVATKPADPTDADYDFGGWYTEAECTNEFDFSQAVNDNIILYAKWTEKTPPAPTQYTLTASVDGGHGSVTPTNATKNKNETVTLTFTPDTGYEIEEVKVNDVATPVSGNTLTLTMDRDKTVVVKYKSTPPTPPTPEQYKVTFDANGGTGTMADVTKNKGESFTLPACGFTPPAGKEFKAWQVDGTEKNVGDNIVLNGDKIIKAVWKDIGSLPPTPPVPPTPYIPGPYPYPWTRYPGWYYNIETPKPKEEKPVSKMEIDWKLELSIGIDVLNREINGVQSKIKMDIAPYIKEGRAMLPVRYVAEALGFDVEWNGSTRTVILKEGSTRVEIPVDTNKIIVNGTVYTSDVKPEIKNNRTMLPIANIARALGLKDGKDIIWNSKSKMVTIYRTIVVK